MRRALLALLTGFLLVTAGCLGPAGPGGTDTTTATSTTTTAEPTTATTTEPTTTTTTGPLAPGVSRDGSVNSSRLLDAHAATLVEAGAVVESNYSDGEDRRFDRVHIDGVRRTDGTVYESARWVNETAFITRTTDGDEVRYRGSGRSPDRHHRRTAIETGRIADILAGASFAVEEVSHSDGTRRATLVSTAFEGDQYRNLSVELVVTGDGVVQSLSATGELEDGTDVDYSYRVAKLDVESVQPPAWVADAPPLVNARLGFDFENCTNTYLTLVHEEGDPLPAGSVVEVTANGTTHSVTLDAALGPDDARSLYLTDGGLRLSTGDPPAGEVVDIGDEVEVRVVTDEGLLVTSGAMGFSCESAGEGSSGDASSGSGSASGGA